MYGKNVLIKVISINFEVLHLCEVSKFGCVLEDTCVLLSVINDTSSSKVDLQPVIYFRNSTKVIKEFFSRCHVSDSSPVYTDQGFLLEVDT